MRMWIRPVIIPPRKWPARSDGPRESTVHGRHRSGGVDSGTRVTIVEFWVPARDGSDERGWSQQGAIRLSGWNFDSGRRAREASEVKDLGGEATAGQCRYR